ncbi:MAG: Atu2307/SP_0267 family LLM class monooxygenase [Actinomycetota bacterium]
MQINFGLDTFGDMTLGDDGKPQSFAQVLRDVVQEAVLAEQVGIDAFNVGEHHRDDFSVSAPDVVLAGIATKTSKIKLGSGVTVLSSDDPIRVYQRFATIDALSSGRAEITAGRGSFIESFPLFGYELSDYARLFEEKLELLVELLKENPVNWQGSIRPPLVNQQVYPKSHSGKIPLRVGVGGSPESVVRAARLDAALALAIIGGDPARFLAYARLYQEQMDHFGHQLRPISIHSPGHIAETDEQAIEELWPHYESSFGRIGRERGWGPMTKGHYLDEVHNGSLYVGSPETVAKKIAYALKSVEAQRFDLKYATGPMPHSKLMQSIELYGTKVIPMVRELLASQLV